MKIILKYRSDKLALINEKTRYEKETGQRFDPTVDFKEKISEHPTQYAFSMTAIKKVGINPKTDYNTPAAVYFYPLDQQRYDELINNKLPFASEQPYCGLVRLNLEDKTKWLIIKESDDNQPESAIQKTLNFLKKSIPEQKVNELYLEAQKDGKNWSNVNVDGKIFIITYFASKYLKENKGERQTIAWRNILVGLGYIAVYDTGRSVIHTSEPTQLFCLLPSAYQLINIYEIRELRKGIATVAAEEFNKKIRDLLHLPPEQRYYAEPIVFKRSRVSIPAGIKFKQITIPPKAQVTIPDNLIVEDDLVMHGTTIIKFGNNVSIGGDLYLDGCRIENIPQINIKGSLNASGINSDFSIADGTRVGKNMLLERSNILKLPDNLKIPGRLNLFECKKIEKLPQNLVIGEDLDIAGTNIKELPDSLVVFETLTVEDIRQMKVGKISVGRLYSHHDEYEKNYKKFGQGVLFKRRKNYFPDQEQLQEIIEEEIIKVLEEERKLGKPSSETNLGDWFKRKGAPGKKGGWVDCNTCRNGKCKPCGRQEGEKRSKYPRCRPTPSQCKGYKRRGDNLQKEE